MPKSVLITEELQQLKREFENAEAENNLPAMKELSHSLVTSYQTLAMFDESLKELSIKEANYWLCREEQLRTPVFASAASDGDDKCSQAQQMKVRPSLSFNDLGGYEHFKKELRRSIVRILISPEDNPHAILLYGPPGTGKTSLAEAAACEVGKLEAFFNAAGSTLLSKYFGESARNISSLYDYARSLNEAAIILIDEIDALGSARGNGDKEGNRLLTSLLTELDGIKGRQNPKKEPITIACTNCIDTLDSALLSRFTKRIYVPLPSNQEIEAILRKKLEKHPVDSTVNLSQISSECESRQYSSRDLSQLISEAITIMEEASNPDYDEIWCQCSLEERKNFKFKKRPLTSSDFSQSLSKMLADR